MMRPRRGHSVLGPGTNHPRREVPSAVGNETASNGRPASFSGSLMNQPRFSVAHTSASLDRPRVAVLHERGSGWASAG